MEKNVTRELFTDECGTINVVKYKFNVHIFNYMRDFIFLVFNFEVFNVLIFCEIKSLKICNYYEQIVINK